MQESKNVGGNLSGIHCSCLGVKVERGVEKASIPA